MRRWPTQSETGAPRRFSAQGATQTLIRARWWRRTRRLVARMPTKEGVGGGGVAVGQVALSGPTSR